MYGVLLILVLVITGGAIAFIGDRLGSKVGKKRQIGRASCRERV